MSIQNSGEGPEAAAEPGGRRRYRRDKRLASADQNRLRVLEAARTMLREEGMGAFTLERVARRAGVSRQTVHNQFGGKQALLEAVFDAAALHGGLDRLPEAFQQPDARNAVRRFVEIFVEFWASDQGLTRRIHALAALEPELAGVMDGRQERRRRASRALIDRFAERPDPVAAAETADALYVLTSFETFDALAGAGREPHAIAALLTRMAHALMDR